MTYEPNPEREDLAITAAIITASKGDGKAPSDFDVLRAATRINRHYADDSKVRALLRSYRLVGTVLGARMEETSKRLVVDFQEDGKDEPEQFRTTRTDERDGDMVRAMVRACTGRRCVVFKTNEPMAKKTGTVRIALYMHPID